MACSDVVRPVWALEQQLIESGLLPLLNLAADRVRIASNGAAVLDQFVVGARRELAGDMLEGVVAL